MAGISGKNGRNTSRQVVKESNFPGTGFKSIRALHTATTGDEFIDITALVTPSIALANGHVAPSPSDLMKVSLLQFKQNVSLISDAGVLVQDVDYAVIGARIIRLTNLATNGQIFELTINAEPRTGTPLVDARPLSVTGVLFNGATDFNVGTPFKVGQFPGSQVGAIAVFADGTLQQRNVGNQPGGAGDYFEVPAGIGLSTLIRFNTAIASNRDLAIMSVGTLVERPDGSQDALIDTLAGQIDVIRGEVEIQHGVTLPLGAPNNVDLKAFGDRVLVLEQSGGGAAHIMQDEGSTLPPRSFLDFQGAGVTVTDSPTATVVTIPGGVGSAYETVEDEGSALTQRTTIDFQGAGVIASDDGSQTVVTIPGGGAVDSVNGATGVVVLDTDDVSEGVTNNYANTPGGQSDISGNTDVSLNTIHRGVTTGNPHSTTQTDVGLSNVTNDAQIPLTQKGAANGVAELDASSRIPSAQLPSSAMEYQGAWNASTNTPVLVDGSGTNGDVYRVSVTGTQNLGSGNISFSLGDAVIYNGTVWQRIPADDLVLSVNGALGVVVLDPDDLDDTSTTNKFTTAGNISKLAGIETAATSDQTDSEIETAYANQVAIPTQLEAETGTATVVRRWTAERVGQAIAALSGGGGGGGGKGITRGFIFDDFAGGTFSSGNIAGLNWTQNLQGGQLFLDTVPGHLGIYQRFTGTSAGTMASLFLGVSSVVGILDPSDSFENQWNLQLPQTDVDTIARMGVSSDGASTLPADAIYIEKLAGDTDWFGVCRSSGVETRVSLGAVDLLYHDFRIRRTDASTIGFTIDTGTEFTITTNIPTIPLTPFFSIRNVAGVNKFINVDFFSLDTGGNAGGGGSGTGYDVIEDESIAVAQRTTLDFQGAGVTVTDDGSNTVVTIPGGGGGAPTFETESFIEDDFTAGDPGTAPGQVNGLLDWFQTPGIGVGAGNPVSGHPGIYNINNLFLTTDMHALLIVHASMFHYDDDFEHKFIFKGNGLTLNASIVRVGIMDAGVQNVNTAVVTGCFLEKEVGDTNWFFVNRSSGVQTRVDSGIATADATWYKIEVRRASLTEIGFTLNGGAETLISTNVPPGSQNPTVGHQIRNASGQALGLDIDYFSQRVTGLSR